MKKRAHNLNSLLVAAEKNAIRSREATTVVIVFRPGRPGRKTANSTSTWRYLKDWADLVEHMNDTIRVLR